MQRPSAKPPPPADVALPRSFSAIGLVFMLCGVGLAILELRYGLFELRLGNVGRTVVLICATGFSVWGLKELIAGWWPGLGDRGFARHRSGFPPEGRLYMLMMVMLFVGALIGRSNPLLLVFALLAGPFVVNGYVGFVVLRRLAVRRVAPQRVMVGEPASIELVVENHKRWFGAWVILVRDGITSAREHLDAEVLLTRVPPGGERAARYRMRLMQRGRYRLGPLRLSTRFPLGFVERALTVALTDTVIVYPRIGRLSHNWRRQLRFATELAPQMSPRSGPFDDEFHKLREYRRGDDVRAIHWKTSARRSELMVREFRESRDRRLVVLLDPWHPNRPTENQRDVSESAFELAATLCVHHLRSSRDAHLALAVGGRTPFLWRSDDGTGMNGLLDGLALHEVDGSTGIQTLFQQTRRERSANARTVCITTRPSSAAEALGTMRNDSSESMNGDQAIEILAADPETAGRLIDLQL